MASLSSLLMSIRCQTSSRIYFWGIALRFLKGSISSAGGLSVMQACLTVFLADGGRAVYQWIEKSGVRRTAEPAGLININKKSDLTSI
jgi:hypothetical protein